jgi:hypothetical protein
MGMKQCNLATFGVMGIAAQASFELTIFLPPPPKGWGYGHVPPVWLSVFFFFSFFQDFLQKKASVLCSRALISS